jgi:hypothetical protein
LLFLAILAETTTQQQQRVPQEIWIKRAILEKSGGVSKIQDHNIASNFRASQNKIRRRTSTNERANDYYFVAFLLFASSASQKNKRRAKKQEEVN